MDNNMLIKSDNSNIFRKIFNFFKKLFSKEENKENNDNNDKYNIELQKKENENNSISILEQKQKILELQKKYENNLIKEDELTETEKESLVNLYKEQINTINNNIQTESKELDLYKQKIIIAREKLKNSKN